MTAPYLILSAPAAPASVRKVRTAVARAVAELAASERVVDDVRLCVSEAVSNVVRHAYGNRGGEVVVVVERVEDGEIEVVVRDTGVGIASSKRRGVGGFGLKIIKEIARRTTISSKPSTGTEVRMAFDVDGTSTRPRRAPPDAATVYAAPSTLARGAAWARWPSWSSKPVRSCNPRLGRFDSGAAPSPLGSRPPLVADPAQVAGLRQLHRQHGPDPRSFPNARAERSRPHPTRARSNWSRRRRARTS